MKTFKIIGVRPLKGCNKHVIKNLKSDTFIHFIIIMNLKMRK